MQTIRHPRIGTDDNTRDDHRNETSAMLWRFHDLKDEEVAGHLDELCDGFRKA